MAASAWPMYHIVKDDASRRNLLAARGPGELPELPQDEAVRAWDWERPEQIERIMRRKPEAAERMERTVSSYGHRRTI